MELRTTKKRLHSAREEPFVSQEAKRIKKLMEGHRLTMSSQSVSLSHEHKGLNLSEAKKSSQHQNSGRSNSPTHHEPLHAQSYPKNLGDSSSVSCLLSGPANLIASGHELPSEKLNERHENFYQNVTQVLLSQDLNDTSSETSSSASDTCSSSSKIRKLISFLPFKKIYFPGESQLLSSSCTPPVPIKCLY